MSAAEPKIKFPLDLTAWQQEKLSRAAAVHGTTKKGLIFSALKKAYGIDLDQKDPTTTTPK
ncbi:MAG: hypothetical protein VR68_11685 [Peptococcaceae bacterium BRH_c4a]|nr:MAG: hypothetical protein VR68_11685 [Peptococcaceae bacterium BRH_c4a]